MSGEAGPNTAATTRYTCAAFFLHASRRLVCAWADRPGATAARSVAWSRCGWEDDADLAGISCIVAHRRASRPQAVPAPRGWSLTARRFTGLTPGVPIYCRL